MPDRVFTPDQVDVSGERVVAWSVEPTSSTQQSDNISDSHGVSIDFADDRDDTQNRLHRYIDPPASPESAPPNAVLDAVPDAVPDVPPAAAPVPAGSVPVPPATAPPAPAPLDAVPVPPVPARSAPVPPVATAPISNAPPILDVPPATAPSAVAPNAPPATADATAGDIREEMAELRRVLAEREETIATLRGELNAEHVAKRQERIAQAKEEGGAIVTAAQEEGQALLAATRANVAQIQHKAREAGRKEGFAEGHGQIEMVIDRLREVTSKIVQKRQDILSGSESQMVGLVLLIARKVIKILTKESKEIVVENVRRALELVRKRGEVTIRINPTDLNLATDELKKITDTIEHDGLINFIVDNLIERGGCLIETEFGEIDARIHSQILEIENKILT